MKTLIISTFCFAIMASAAEKKGNIKGMDTDKDGKISMAEFQTARPGKKAENRFRKLDANSDGFLNMDEVAAARSARKGAK